MTDQKVIDFEQGKALADEYGIKFIEASAKSNIGVDDAFITLAKDIKARLIDNAEADAPSGSGASVVSGDDLKGSGGGGSAAEKKGCC